MIKLKVNINFFSLDNTRISYPSDCWVLMLILEEPNSRKKPNNMGKKELVN